MEEQFHNQNETNSIFLKNEREQCINITFQIVL